MVVVVLGAVAFATAARRSDVRGAGHCPRDARRDKDAEIDPAPTAPTSTDVELAGEQARGRHHHDAREVEPTAPVEFVPPDPEVIGVNRRHFLNVSMITLMSAGLGTFAAAGFVAFLWPTASGGFGGKINIGKMDDVLTGIENGSGFFYNATAKSWVTPYPSEALPKAKAVAAYAPVLSTMELGIAVLYQKCPHLGCRVPSCVSSQWFECPCHGSQYNHVGEKKGGPAPRGMDRFVAAMSSSGDVVIDTATVYPGPPIGTNTTGQEAEGPHCITGGE